MTIDLSKVVFSNDIFTSILPDGGYIVLNKVDENFTADGFTGECVVRNINVEIINVDGNVIMCPCVIGLGNDLMQINTDHTEYEGAVLTPDNMVYCTIEVYDL